MFLKTDHSLEVCVKDHEKIPMNDLLLGKVIGFMYPTLKRDNLFTGFFFSNTFLV